MIMMTTVMTVMTVVSILMMMVVTRIVCKILEDDEDNYENVKMTRMMTRMTVMTRPLGYFLQVMAMMTVIRSVCMMKGENDGDDNIEGNFWFHMTFWL